MNYTNAGRAFVRVEGTEGWIENTWFEPGGFSASDEALLQWKPDPDEAAFPLITEKQDFVNCIKNRKETMIPAEIGHRTAIKHERFTEPPAVRNFMPQMGPMVGSRSPSCSSPATLRTGSKGRSSGEKHLLEAAAFMDANKCNTVTAAARNTAGKSSEDILAELDAAAGEFGKSVQAKFAWQGEWT